MPSSGSGSMESTAKTNAEALNTQVIQSSPYDLTSLQAETVRVLEEFGTSTTINNSTNNNSSGNNNNNSDRRHASRTEKDRRRKRRLRKKKKGSRKSITLSKTNKAAASLQVVGDYDKVDKFQDTFVDQAAAAPSHEQDSLVKTIEVFDNSEPIYSSDDENDYVDEEEVDKDKMRRRSVREVTEREDGRKNLVFGQEESRVRSSMDAFKVGSNVTLSMLQSERLRLDSIAAINNLDATREKEHLKEVETRQKWLSDDVKVNEIQRVFRGWIGRRRCDIRRRINGFQDKVVEGWVEVRDQERGEVWYYNSITEESVWERPAGMGGMTSNDKIQTLPPVSALQQSTRTAGDGSYSIDNLNDIQEEKKDQDAFPNIADFGNITADKADAAGVSKLQKKGTSGGNLPPIKSFADSNKGEREGGGGGEKEVEGEDEEDEEDDDYDLGQDFDGMSSGSDDFDLSDMEEEKTRLFLADGSVNGRLRDTISQSLKVSRFDSVSTLLASAGPELDRNDDSASAVDKKKRERAKMKKKRKKRGERPIFLQDKEKKMVSVMRIKGLRDEDEGSLPPPQDGKAPSSSSSPSKQTSPIKSLSLHDVPHTGFDINKDDPLHPSKRSSLSAPHSTKDQPPDAASKGDEGLNAPKTLDPDTPVQAQVDMWKASSAKGKGVCFNCWSAGKGKRCVLHKDDVASSKGKKESALMCKNWDLGVLRRRYRAEEIQEVFMKSASSLRYDKDRKQFCTVVEQRHPIYRLTSHRLARYNFTSRRKHHCKAWLQSFIELLRTGKVPGSESVNRSAKMLRLRNSLTNLRGVRKYTNTSYTRHPKPPITGTTLAERRGQVKLIVEKVKVFERPENKKEERTFRYIVVDGTPIPYSLYMPRVYELFAPKSIPMPEPNYKAEPEVAIPNIYIPEEQAAAWMERLVSRIARDVETQAKLMIKTMSPIPGIDKLKRTKYPPPLTIKFATFARKPTKNNMAVGGLSAELTVYELVTTYVPPQYGHFTVMDRASIAPDISAEITATFRTAAVNPLTQIYVERMLQHPLNSRRPPTITLSTAMDPSNKYYFGFNRPNQTGEEEPHGFRTAVFCMAPIFDAETNPDTFLPSHEVATLNLPAANRTVTTHADRNYPFCEPTNRDNTTLDFYHLLLLGVCSPSKEQVFTNLGVQEPGDFMRGCDSMRPLGHCVAVIYRSWAFLQKAPIEEFLTDDGIPYWYDRRTGETFWERPLHKEEKVPVKEGGSVLGGGGEMPSVGQGASEGYKPRYDQRDMRKAMIRKHESEEMTIERRKAAAQSATWAKEQGILPELPVIGGVDLEDQEATEGNRKEPDFGSSMLGAARGSPKSKSGLGSPSGARPVSVQQSNRGEGSAAEPLPLSPPRLGSPSKGRRRSNFGASSSGGEVAELGSPSKQSLTDGVGELKPEAAGVVAALTQTLAGALTAATNPEDILRIGMGLGMSLQAQGVIQAPATAGSDGVGSPTMMRGNGDFGDGSAFPDGDRVQTAGSGWDVKVREPVNGHPIGMANPTKHVGSQDKLDHADEEAQKNALLRDTAGIKTSDSFKGMVVVEPTAAPDEISGEERSVLMDSEEQMKLTVPVVAYPETRVGPLSKEFETHEAAGYGTSFVKEGEGQSQKIIEGKGGVVVRKSGDAVPEGFLNAISATHVGQQNVDYLPNVPNLPQCKPVGRVKPRSAAEDWLAIGFDPWSAGKEPLSTEFITSLTTAAATVKDDSILDNKEAEGAFINLMDKKGIEAQQEIAAQENKMAQDFAELCSYVRHGKYREVEEKMNEPDWTLPIDYPDAVGNTLLMVACQNGNKRIAKLCLRRGAELNKQNINGQSCLHYAFGYGFEDLGEYLIEKGADDSLKNADNLTCYEGLNMDDVIGI